MQNTPILTPRLQCIADMVAPCRCLADIGTDHAYLPAFLCKNGISTLAIASDLRAMPLRHAQETISRYNLADRITTRLGGGATVLSPGEADAIVIAGMGGLMIAQILQESPDVFAKADQILIQPMSSIPELRSLLWEINYRINQEVLTKEGEKRYHILSLSVGREADRPDPLGIFMGRTLMRDKPTHYAEYFAAQKQILTKRLDGLSRAKERDIAAMEETRALLGALSETQKGE